MAKFPARRQAVHAKLLLELYGTSRLREQLAACYGLLYTILHDYPEGGR
jgi:hypothetical protein